MTSSRPLGRVCGTFVLIVVLVSLLFCGRGLARTGPLSTNAASASLGRDQLFFERNDGQADQEVMYLSRASRYSIFLTRTGLTVVLAQVAKDSRALALRPSYFRLTFENANSQAQIAGVEQLPGISNYFSGSDPKQWHTRIPQFTKVRYAQLYPGIDVIFYFRDGQLEYDLVAAPGADLTAVHFRIEGAAPSLTRAGDAAIEIGGHEVVRWAKPHAYQDGLSTRAVSAHYSLHQDRLSFAVDHYDRTQPLVIDPALIFATYITSNCSTCVDSINDIAADSTGVYLTGQTNASAFPATASGPAPTAAQNYHTFVVKLDPTGSHILYASFLSSSSGQAIAIDGHGSAYVSGAASMGSPAFPLTSGVFSGTIPANPGELPVGYAAKLSPDGSTILYSTLLQQPTSDGSLVSIPYLVSANKIAVDSAGALYVAGVATSEVFIPQYQSVFMSLPATAGAFQTTPGVAFVMKLNPNASGLEYATYIDGPTGLNLRTSVGGVAIDGSGDTFVTGSTNSTTFPITPGAYQSTVSSDSQGNYATAYVMKLNPSGTAPIYSTFFGASNGSGSLSYGVAVDDKGQAAIAGYAAGTLPITSNAFCGNPTTVAATGFVAKLTADGSALVYTSSLCGDFSEAASIGMDSTGAAYVVGFAAYPTTFQPVLLDPIQGYVPPGDYPNSYANVVIKVDISGNLQWATFLGMNEFGPIVNSKIAVDATGDAYVVTDSNIPPTPNSLGPSTLASGVPYNDETPDFLVKIAPSLGAPVPLSMPSQVSFGSENIGVASSPTDVQLGNFGDAPMSPVIATSGDFSETDNCSASVPGGQKCDINVVFTPTAAGNRTGTLTITFGGSVPPQTVALSGVGTVPAVSLSPPALYFRVQATGTTSGQQQVTVTNTGTGSLTVSSVQATTQFAATNTCGAPVAAGSTCTIQVTFTPTASGIQTGTLTINDNASNSPQTVALTGNQTGNAAVTLSPTTLTFAVQNNGMTSPPQTVTVTNSGTAPLVVSSVQTTSQFAASSACPASVQPGSTCTIQVTFTPSASGTQTGTLTITDNAANSPQTLSLAGNQPSGFSVSAPGGSTSTSASVSAGQTATYSLSVSGTFGFSGAVNFICSGAPVNSKCSVTPNPASVSGASAVAVTVSVVTQAASSVFLRPNPPTPFAIPYAPVGIAVTCALLLSFAFVMPAKRRQLSCIAGALALTLLTVVFVGCGGGSGSSSTGPAPPSNPGTAAGQYMLTVTGTFGSLSQSMNLSLTVK
jgi:Abnormal spindle-like microcephaly-assoc'd, ASPM-SPD-2-Hydin/Protein of unknown function (DUF1573)